MAETLQIRRLEDAVVEEFELDRRGAFESSRKVIKNRSTLAPQRRR